jgi:hypothetical protein
MEALAPGGAAGRREGGPQPKGRQSQRWLEREPGGGGLDLLLAPGLDKILVRKTDFLQISLELFHE